MKIVVQVKLAPEAEQAAALSATLHTVNAAANWVSTVAFERGVPREYRLRKHTYAELRSRGDRVKLTQRQNRPGVQTVFGKSPCPAGPESRRWFS